MKNCQQCGKEITIKTKYCRYKKFCNQSCAAKHNNKVSKTKPKKSCLFCQKTIPRKNQFCNVKCQQELNLANKIKGVIETGTLHESNIQGYASAKRILIKIFERKCFICQNVSWMNQQIPLVLDHIDGNSENGKLENCRLVCGNCDMQLPTYKSKNKGKGRAYRRQRYKEGKSF